MSETLQTAPIDVAALGEAMIEFNQTRPGDPSYLQGFGGDTSNAVIAAARAGARTSYLTRVGDDTFGRTLSDLWVREGVDIRAVARDAAHPTGVYFVTHGGSGHSFSYLRAGSAASRMTPQWLEEAAVQQVLARCRILHVSGISLAISASACDTAFAAMRQARSAGARVALDPNLRLKLWPLDRAQACLRQAIALCDIFLPSLDDLSLLTGLTSPEAMVDWSHAQGAATVVLKLGADGVLLSENGQSQRLAGHRVEAVDATGAGDCFDGNLLARLALGDGLGDAALYANAAAALSVQGYGAVAPLPTAEQVRKALA